MRYDISSNYSSDSALRESARATEDSAASLLCSLLVPDSKQPYPLQQNLLQKQANLLKQSAFKPCSYWFICTIHIICSFLHLRKRSLHFAKQKLDNAKHAQANIQDLS
jgi:hypothetical protein